MVIIEKSVQKARLLSDNKVAIGYDTEKVKQGKQDLTRLRDIDKSKSWSNGIVACKIIDWSKTKEELEGLCEVFNIELLK